ncbi:MAG: selenide, water dikinase SelD [Pseudomonadota bacterium]
MMSTAVKLTEYSHGAGCGCKIAPGLLEEILSSNTPQAPHPALLVGNQSKDDAAAFDLGNGTSVLSTTDFFMPIVDDPAEFGRIAATNALSDIYAMGGKPLMAIAILGWPVDKLGPEVARQVIEGGRSACRDAGIPLAGGHSIDSPEPIFGLAVTGLVDNHHLKRNDTASAGCQLFLSKPLGIGILTTAQKQKKLQPQHRRIAPDTMCTLNAIGTELSQIEGITAITDVTGFGLLGHLGEICEGSGIAAIIDYDAVPRLPHVEEYLAMGCSPGGAQRNFDSYGGNISVMTEQQRAILCDPQTSGGLLVAVKPEAVKLFLEVTANAGLELSPIGETVEAHNDAPLIKVI